MAHSDALGEERLEVYFSPRRHGGCGWEEDPKSSPGASTRISHPQQRLSVIVEAEESDKCFVLVLTVNAGFSRSISLQQPPTRE